ncbi:MAG: peptidoglycan-binding domain-containing protein [Candidatus Methylomirabilales bacterium]
MVYQLGAKGPEVAKMQTRLKELDYYRGPIDGDFGGGTESAVKGFQRAQRLAVDGIVGPKTWDRLFPQEEIPAPAILQKPLAYRCLALTGAFETGAPIPECFAGLSGDFDGQGMSFGALQWNLGQGTLQPLLQGMDRSHPHILKQIFHEHHPVLRTMLKAAREEQLAWARSIQDPRRFVLYEPWRGLFKTLGRREEFQDIQVEAADRLYRSAVALCKPYDLRSERVVALMFDIKVQNGTISELVKAQIEQDFKRLELSGHWEKNEVARLRIIANRRAEAADPRWVEDVRARKLTIANGGGTVHGNAFDLAEQYGIRLKAARAD